MFKIILFGVFLRFILILLNLSLKFNYLLYLNNEDVEVHINLKPFHMIRL